MHQLSGNKINQKYWSKIKPDLDIEFINRFINMITNYNNILHWDDNERNILLYVRKAWLNIACSMIDNRLSDKELSSGNCFIHRRNLTYQKEIVIKSANFIDLTLKKSTLKNVSVQIYKLIKP